MIRLKILFYTLLSGMFLAGCANQDMLNIEEEGPTTYLQVYISRADLQTRTVSSSTTPGTPEENAVSDIMLYLMSGSGIMKIENINILDQSGNSYVSALIPIERSLLNQEYELFVVANAGKIGLPLRSTRDFKDVYSTQGNTYKVATPGQMLMSSQVEQSPVPTIVITQENTRDNPARATVHLDRLAVKIEPQVSTNFKANFANHPREDAFFEGFAFAVEAAGLLNAATEFNLEQQWSIETGGQPIQLLSPTWYYKPEAQYFNRYYNTIEAYTGSTVPPFVSIESEEASGYYLISSPLYCLENNSPFYDYTGSVITPENQVKTKYKGLTTAVLFKVQATKNNVAASFYRYQGKYYADTTADRAALTAAAGLVSSDFASPSTLRAKDVSVFENGYMYYTYWIKDKNPTYAGDDYDLSYSVIRNTYYKLQVNGITVVGNDVPGGDYEPDAPIDKIDQMEIIAVAQDWTLVDVTHTFN